MSLARLIQAHRQEVLEHWKEQVRTLGDARALSEPALVDHVPEMLDWLVARQVGRRAVGDYPGQLLSREHAQERMAANFDLVELLAELSVLRDVLLQLWVEAPEEATPREVLHLSQDLDDVVTVCATEFTRELLRLERGHGASHAPGP